MSPRRRADVSRTEPTAKQAESSYPYLETHARGEDPNTPSVEVADMWAQAYSELVDFETKLLDRVRKGLGSLSPAARHEAELTNIPMIMEHLQTFKYRHAWWRRRRLEIGSQVANTK